MLSGHDRGLHAREYFGVEKLEEECDFITIVSESSLDAVTPSFVQGFLGTSKIIEGGKIGFLNKYKFDTPEIIQEDFIVGFERLLMKRKIASDKG